MSSVKYDTVELVNATYIPRYAKHENAPERIINSIKLARQDGAVIVDDTFEVKYIDIQGILKADTQELLDTAIDNFKELISRVDKNLDIEWGGGTRRYVCRSISHNFNRDFYNLAHCPYTVRFLVPSGLGTDISATTALNDTGIVDNETQNVVSFLGSYKAKPVHKITITTRDNADVLKVENEDSDEYMEIRLDGFVDNDYVEIDEENLTVKKNGIDNVDYIGKFPSVEIGSNNLKLTISGNGFILDQSQTGGITLNKIYNNAGTTKRPTEAQSFVPSLTGRIGRLLMDVAKVDGGSLAGNMVWYIREDDNNKPGGIVGGGNGFKILKADVPTSSAFTIALFDGSYSDAPFLVKGRRYWIQLNEGSITTSDASNYFAWVYDATSPGYDDGKAIARGKSTESWFDGVANADDADGITLGNYDKNFYEYRGDGDSPGWSVIWLITYTKKYL